MKVHWTGTQCILCLEEGALTEEHLIPRALGGRLSCQFLCRSCNSRFGSQVEAAAKRDPSILLAARKLRDDIPKLSQALVESHPHVSTGKGPRSSGYIRNGAFHIRPQKCDDGSLILPTDSAGSAISKILRKEGYGDAPIEYALETWQSMPENRRSSIAEGLNVVKWSIEGIELDLGQSKVIDPLLPAKIAFEFLALCAGEAICSRDGRLPELRRILTTGIDWDDSILRVERLHAGDPRPFHGICNEENPQYSQVQVRLFGCLAYRVHFPRLYIEGGRFAYTQRLATGQQDVRIVGGRESSGA